MSWTGFEFVVGRNGGSRQIKVRVIIPRFLIRILLTLSMIIITDFSDMQHFYPFDEVEGYLATQQYI